MTTTAHEDQYAPEPEGCRPRGLKWSPEDIARAEAANAAPLAINKIVVDAPEPVSGERPAVWGDFFTCTGCRDLEECRRAFGEAWGPDGTGCADWSPKP